MSDTDDMLGGLSDLVNMADTPQIAKKPAASKPEKPVQEPKASVSKQAQVGPDLSQQILVRLDGIKAGIDALCVATDSPVPVDTASTIKPEAKPMDASKGKQPAPKPVVQPTVTVKNATSPLPKSLTELWPQGGVSSHEDSWANRVSSMWPYLILVSAAMELIAFALGMGYGAMVAAQKLPFWYRPGVAGSLIDWIDAPAGILLLPVIAGLLVLGGFALRKEGHAAFKVVFGIAGFVGILALIVPFIA